MKRATPKSLESLSDGGLTRDPDGAERTAGGAGPPGGQQRLWAPALAIEPRGAAIDVHA